jgi:GntR family transcriptional regulator
MAQPLYQRILEDLRKRIQLGASLRADSAQSAAAIAVAVAGAGGVTGAGGEAAAAGPDASLPAALRPGDRLPTEIELSEAYQVSRNTIREAIRRLTSQGLVETRQGQGTFVTRKIDPFVTYLSPPTNPANAVASVDPQQATYLSEVSERPRGATHTVPDVRMKVPELEVGNRLRLEPDVQVVCRHQMRYIDGIPWSLQTTFYPMELVTAGATSLLMAQDIKGGAVRYLADTLDIRQEGYRDWITARNPDKNEQEFFGIAHDATVFVIFRTGFDQHKRPMRVTVTIFPADRNQFIVDSGEVPDPQYGPDVESDSL